MSKRIALVIGHGPTRDRGAENADGTTELDWNRDLANRIAQAVDGRVPVTIIHRQIEKVTPVTQVNASGASVAVELHLNSFNTRASGTEMIYWPSSVKGKNLALKLQDAACKVLRLPDRGVKGPQAGGRGSGFLRGTSMPAVIVESFFIDNDGDLARGNHVKNLLAVAYADALVSLA